MPPGESSIYEAKYGWNRQTALIAGIGLIVCVIMVLVSWPLWARIFIGGFFGLGVLIVAAASLTRRTALRIDASGVAVCRYALQPSSAVFYPWEDVERLLIWNFQRLQYVGVVRRKGTAPLPKRLGRVSRTELGAIAPGIPLEVAATAAVANGWVLDKKRLADAVARFAPTVEVLDLTTGRLLNS